MRTKVLSGAIFFFITAQVFSQTTIELPDAAGSGGPAGRGLSIANQSVTLFNNSTTTGSPAITAVYSLSNQQFSSIEGNPTTPGVVFGNNSPSATNANIVPATGSGELLYPAMNLVGNPQNSHFTTCNSCAVGTGITVMIQTVNFF